MRTLPTNILKALAITTLASGLACCATTPPDHAGGRVADASARSACLASGSRIPQAPGVCRSGPGRSYSAQELQSTGKIDPAEALSLLDPSITTR